MTLRGTDRYRLHEASFAARVAGSDDFGPIAFEPPSATCVRAARGYLPLTLSVDGETVTLAHGGKVSKLRRVGSDRGHKPINYAALWPADLADGHVSIPHADRQRWVEFLALATDTLRRSGKRAVRLDPESGHIKAVTFYGTLATEAQYVGPWGREPIGVNPSFLLDALESVPGDVVLRFGPDPKRDDEPNPLRPIVVENPHGTAGVRALVMPIRV